MGVTFLDLFAGSGGIGIEALSRGAAEAVFVEKSPRAMACIKENLNFTKLSPKAVTMQTDVLTALRRLEGEKKFDYIFMDPPYNQSIEEKVLLYLARICSSFRRWNDYCRGSQKTRSLLMPMRWGYV